MAEPPKRPACARCGVLETREGSAVGRAGGNTSIESLLLRTFNHLKMK
jgi:hypothetical protein